jgi:short subunit dehydrogenase-like uncharacterized protein
MTRIFGYRFTPGLGSLATSFTGPGNGAIVYRSYSQNPKLYGPNFHFEEYIPVAGFWSAVLVHLFTMICVMLASLTPIRALLRRLSPSLGSGPDIEEIGKSERAVYHAVGDADCGDSKTSSRVYASFTREGALYEFTALLAGVGASVLLEKSIEAEKEGRNPESGGIMTPSSLGMQYVERLREAGAKIDVRMLD